MIAGSLGRLKKYPMVKTLTELSGNSRICVYTEPLYTIPYNMLAPFITLYMYNLGLDDIKIGTIISVGLFIQLITAFIGGVMTDIIGRRKLTLVTDLLSWSVPCLIWMLAKNFWWFLAAAIFNAILQIPTISWTCLLVEDSDRNQLGVIYTWIFIGGMVSGFFVPLGGLLVGMLTIVPAMRIMYLIFFVLMTTKILLLYKYSTETKQGIIRMAETKSSSFISMLRENYKILLLVIKSRKMSITLAVMVMLNITSTVGSTFYSLLTTQSLNVPETLLGYFPIIRAVCMLIFMFVFQSALYRFNVKLPMLVGILIYIAGQFFLVTAQYVGMPFIIAYVVSDAFALSIVTPIKDTVVAANVNPVERARIVGIMTSVMLGMSIPFGYLAGVLSAQNRNFPFFMNIIIYIALFALIMSSRNLFNENQ